MAAVHMITSKRLESTRYQGSSVSKFPCWGCKRMRLARNLGSWGNRHYCVYCAKEYEKKYGTPKSNYVPPKGYVR
jgi:hypothetical protein